MNGDFPWPDKPRQFVAVAMPHGDARHGIEGQLIQLTERRGDGGPIRLKLLARSEAEDLVQQLRGALRVFDLAPRLADDLAPKASHAPYPNPAHRSLAEVGDADHAGEPA